MGFGCLETGSIDGPPPPPHTHVLRSFRTVVLVSFWISVYIAGNLRLMAIIIAFLAPPPPIYREFVGHFREAAMADSQLNHERNPMRNAISFRGSRWPPLILCGSSRVWSDGIWLLSLTNLLVTRYALNHIGDLLRATCRICFLNAIQNGGAVGYRAQKNCRRLNKAAAYPVFL